MELRKDYILDRYVIVSSSRGKRPFEFKREKEHKEEGKTCFFCPGNENLTPPEIGRIGTKKEWKIRWFPNKFPAVDKKGNPNLKTKKEFFTSASAYGHHEVIVETDDHKKQLADLTVSQIKKVLNTYIDRIKNLSREKNIKYVCIFKNHGRNAGTSLVHSHSQLIAYNKLPESIKKKIKSVKKYKKCPYCKIIKLEKKSERKCFENSSFVSFAPYASRFHFENWIFPKKHLTNLTHMSEKQLEDLAKILKKILSKLKKLNASYNMELFYAPKGKDLHFHIEISPRISIIGGFEILSDDVINSLAPEEAAKFYRGEK